MFLFCLKLLGGLLGTNKNFKQTQMPQGPLQRGPFSFL